MRNLQTTCHAFNVNGDVSMARTTWHCLQEVRLFKVTTWNTPSHKSLPCDRVGLRVADMDRKSYRTSRIAHEPDQVQPHMDRTTVAPDMDRTKSNRTWTGQHLILGTHYPFCTHSALTIRTFHDKDRCFGMLSNNTVYVNTSVHLAQT
jgi:hypothetical protein